MWNKTKVVKTTSKVKLALIKIFAPIKQSVSKAISRIKPSIIKLVIPLFFILTIIPLYYFEPQTFENSWKGRAPYLIFLGLLIFELAIAWKRIINKKITFIRAGAIVIAIIAPILYVLAFFSTDLKSNIIELGKVLSVYVGLDKRVDASAYLGFIQIHWPLSFEYLVISSFFTVSIWFMYGFDGIKKTAVSLLFIWATTTFFMIDTMYPFGTFAILNNLSIVTTFFVAYTLNAFGYNVGFRLNLLYDNPIIEPPRFPNIVINWPCAGIHSLIIYTVIILLFLKNVTFKPLELPVNVRRKLTSFICPIFPAWLFRSVRLFYRFFKTKIVFITIFLIGALGTFLVNIMRIVSIVVIMIKYEPKWGILFHTYYGELYFLAWILIYPSIIIYAPRITAHLSKVKSKRAILKSAVHP